MENPKKKNTADLVYDWSLEPAEKLGLRIWDVVFVKEGAEWFLRIYIDKDTGVSIDDCVDMTHEMNPILDREDPIQQEYTFEVSSPGINRRLTKPFHFEACMGAEVDVRLIRPDETGRKAYTGVLCAYHCDGSFDVQISEETVATFVKKECAVVSLAGEV